MVDKKFMVKKGVFGKKNQDAYQFSYVGNFKEKTVQEFFVERKFAALKWWDNNKNLKYKLVTR